MPILRQYWGHDAFRPMQEEVILSVYEGKDTLALMPTGGGKSLTYQLPALAKKGICIVITPLIALMKDQTDALRKRGIASVAIHSGMTPRQIDIALDNCVYGEYKFLYIAPERIDSEMFRARFARMDVSLITVDEAHCISQWGYDFRPAYLKISRLRKLHPGVPVLALTASATPEVVDDIIDKLEFREKNLYRVSFRRKNLSYILRQTENKPEQLLRVIRNVRGSGIVYTRTREKAEKTAAYLQENGISSDFYHGGLGYLMRSIKQDKWIKGETQVIVATNAFGMGIDKADVRYVIHADLVDSLESYYQEAGRAGRDGNPAYAVLLISEQDNQSVRKRIGFDFPPIETIKEIYEAVCNFYQIEIGTGKGFAREFNIYEFCARNHYFIPTVINAFKILHLNGYMLLTDETDHPSRVVFTVNRDDLYKVQVEKEELDYFIKVLLRTYTGIFNDFVAVNENEIAYLSGYTLERIHELFKRLWQLRLIKYIPGNRAAMAIFLEERLSPENLRISPESYALRKQVAEERLTAMIGYAENNSDCRSLVLQRYFGEEDTEPCGKCDICREKKRGGHPSGSTPSQMVPEKNLREKILGILDNNEVSLHQLTEEIRGELDLVLKEVRELTENGLISQGVDGLIRKK